MKDKVYEDKLICGIIRARKQGGIMEPIEAGQVVLKKLNEAGFEAYFVGGMVRDQLLGRPLCDIDVTTSATPEIVQTLFEKTYATGLAHGTVTVMINDIPVEVTTYRVDGKYLDYRHPEQVVFTSSLVEDLQRRDFTINAMAMDLRGELCDPLGGLEDLKAKIIRAAGVARNRFLEDPLRMIRAIRFVSKLGFDLEPDTYKAIKEQHDLLAHLAKERIKKEVEGIMTGSYRDQALKLLFATNLLDELMLSKYESYSFTSLNQGLDFFVLASLEVLDVKSFLDQWPFSRTEKKFIQIINELFRTHPHGLIVQYRYGVEVAALYQRLYCFLSQKHEEFVPAQLVIQNRQELALAVPDILALTKQQVGPWIGELLEQVETAVVLGNLANDREQILEFIREQGIL